MVRTLTAALLALSAAASAAPVAPLALPSFENAAAALHAAVRAQRAASVKTLDAGTAQRVDALAWDLERSRQDVGRLRDQLRWLMGRVRSPRPGQPDQNLRWELQGLVRDLDRVVRDGRWRLDDLRALSSQVAGKAPDVVAPAQRLVSDAGWLQSDAHWFVFDAGFASPELMRAGYAFESMDLDRNARDLDQLTRDLQTESQRLLDKVR